MKVILCDQCQQRMESSGFVLDRLSTYPLAFGDPVGPWHFCSGSCLRDWVDTAWLGPRALKEGE